MEVGGLLGLPHAGRGEGAAERAPGRRKLSLRWGTPMGKVVMVAVILAFFGGLAAWIIVHVVSGSSAASGGWPTTWPSRLAILRPSGEGWKGGMKAESSRPSNTAKAVNSFR